uniref:Uncharacterized protein n=1 Tax=Rhizophora mucronata TaxID=61149 RepID=A0A2P2KAK3_RHIMU
MEEIGCGVIHSFILLSLRGTKILETLEYFSIWASFFFFVSFPSFSCFFSFRFLPLKFHQRFCRFVVQVTGAYECCV